MDENSKSPLLARNGAVADGGDDAAVAAHYGDPTREQRALARGTAVVDLSHRSVVTVSGPDRLSWLSTLSSQEVAGLKPGESTELLLLDISGRIEHDAAVVDDGETAWLITESSHGAVLAQWLDSMKFMLRVEITDRTAEYAVLGSTAALPAPAVAEVLVGWEDPWPQLGPGAASYAQVAEADHPGADWSWRLSVVPRTALEATVAGLEQAGWNLAGTMAAEALRVAAWRPRLAREVDEKTIPHELDLIRTAVHLSKGCYKGQETVARVHNLGHPPRRLVFLHLDGSEHTLPALGADVLAADASATPEQLAQERPVGKLTSVARHHEMGPIALALVKRKVDPELQLVVRDGDADSATYYAAAQEVIVRPDAGQAVGRPQGDFLRGQRR
ncbi:folate-binding protein YgfZ [Nesterenkonia sp. E16_7]|uniref:CAF17-like 4Fe-4S cluster assembly/insertion protein YgfZ n=1 Tax=unclassified Nesterenkonia TaxID=2629769 RepID=UPI001A9114FC|nr:folate-binding protein YgfZ [Nesterenkonia sp. E16_10]MBO0597648.1 folate-binding protein YgfZ [Nesterenkonia sp. E16_7]